MHNDLPCPISELKDRNLAVGHANGRLLGLTGNQVPPHLTGENGTYRCDGICLLGEEVNHDFAVIDLWLNHAYQRTESIATRSSYRKEIIRLMRWAFRANKPLSSISVSDAQDYIAYLAQPDPIDIGTKKVSILHPEWHPFHGGLSKGSIQTAKNTLGSFYSFAVQNEYSRCNPFLNVNAPKKKGLDTVERYLSDEATSWLFNVANEYCLVNAADKNAILNRWIVTCLLGLAIRVSEAATSTNQMKLVKLPDGNKVWTIKVQGKGAKKRELILSQDVLTAFQEYRIAFGLPALPVPGQSDEPLIMNLKGSHAISRATLHNRIKKIMRMAKESAEKANDFASATELNAASAHWLRHTTATRLANDPKNSIHIVSNFLGHASVATTSIYVHTNLTNQANMIKGYKSK